MTKQNRIHKILVVRERCRKEICRTLSGIYNAHLFRMERKRTFTKAAFKRIHKEYNNE